MRIPASAYNAFVDAAKANKGVKQDARRGTRREQPDGVTLVKNNSGVAITRFGVLGVDGPIFLPSDSLDAFKRDVVLTGSTPVAVSHTGKFVVALEPIAAGDIGKACADGVCITQVNFPDPNVSNPCFAEISNGVTTSLFARHRGDAEILWHEGVPGGGGTVWAIVRIGDSNAAAIFPVNLTQVGGVDGTGASPATWTYDVFDALPLGGFDPNLPPIVSAADPTAAPSVWARPPTGSVVKATAGLAFYDDSNALALAWINEVFVAGGVGDFQAYFVHAVRVGGTIATPPIVGDPATITYDIKADPNGATADFTGVSPTHARPTNATGQVVAAAVGDVCAAKIGVDAQQNPTVDQLVLIESEPQKLLVANDDEPGYPVVAPWVGNAGASINNPTRLEAIANGDGSTTLKLITNALAMALKHALPGDPLAAQDPADPFANKLVIGSATNATETILSTVTIAGGSGITSFVVQTSALEQAIVIGSFHSGAPSISGLTLQFPRNKVSMSVSVVGGVATLTVAATADGFDSIPLKVGD